MSGAVISLRDRQRQLREEAILEAANRLLSEKGYQGMTMDDLANRVGIAKGSLYQHFRSKDELVGVALVAFMNRISDHISTLPPSQPAIERLKLTFRNAFTLRFREGFPDVLSMKQLIKDSLKNHPEYVASANRFGSALAGLFEMAKKQGDIAQDIPTDVLVFAAIGRMRDPELDALIAEGRIQADDIVELQVQLFLGGVVTDWQRAKMRRTHKVYEGRGGPGGHGEEDSPQRHGEQRD
jgi:AcrR family transcriptional regulator